MTETSATVSWIGVPGADRYQLQLGDTAAGPWSVVDDAVITGTSHTVPGLMCRTRYFFRVSAAGDGTTYSVFFGTPSAPADDQTTACTLNAPENLDVTPLPERKAMLTWMITDPNADGVVVEVRYPNLHNNPWTPIASTIANPITCDPPPTPRKCKMDIDLDRILSLRGLAHADAYELGIKVTDNSNTYMPSVHSKVTIIDTPIISIDGDSRGRTADNGQAVVKWTTPPDIPVYALRFRKLSGDHTQIAWRPRGAQSGEWRRPISQPTYDQTNPPVMEHRVRDLDQQDLYAFQLNYTVGAVEYFSAREAYVWPSDRPAGGGERVAEFPLNYPPSNKTYSYVVCGETFPSGTEDDWKKLISHAFSQWDLATNNLVTTERVAGECADYSAFVDEIRTEVQSFISGTNLPVLPDSQIAAQARAVLKNFKLSAIQSTKEQDYSLNEVFMIDNDSTDFLVKVMVFEEISIMVGHGWCPNLYACTDRSPREIDPITADIRLFGSEFDAMNFNVPGGDDIASVGEIPFNSCAPVDYRYTTLVHEAGHALGIVEGNTGTGQVRHHPTIKDSVMSYSNDPSVSCSPPPVRHTGYARFVPNG